MKLFVGMRNLVQNRNRNSKEKEAFLNINKIIAASLLTDGFPYKTLVTRDTVLKKYGVG